MTNTFYIIKSSNMSLEDTYRLIHMKRQFQTAEQAKDSLSKADPDIIPKNSTIFIVKENITKANNRLSVDLYLYPLNDYTTIP